MITISRFSGKCDFYDDICIFGLERILRAKVYVGNSEAPLELGTYKDCIPYFPYIVSSAGYNKGGVDVIHLTSKSWVDIQEERYGENYILGDHYRRELQNELDKYSEDN